MDKVAQRIAQKAHDLRGVLTDIPYPTWEDATEAQREFWRAIARVSQEPDEKPKPAPKKTK